MTHSQLVDDPRLVEHLSSVLGVNRVSPRRSRRRLEPELSYGRHLDPPHADARPAAVAILLYQVNGDWHIPFVLRPQAMRNHAGQVAFPGGQVDPGESTVEAGLRELDEELGISRLEPAIIGPLSPMFLFVTNFVVHPWVVTLPHRPRFVLCQREVAEVLEVPLSHLVEPANIETLQERRNGIEVKTPCIRWQQHNIWGATAIVLGEFLDVLQTLAQDGE